MKIPTVQVEIWKPIPGYPGYEASNYGNLRSYRSLSGRGPLATVPRLLSPTRINGRPYLQATLSNGPKRSQVRVHQTILITFIGPRPSPSHVACHNDGDANNNKINNLCWDTAKANSADQLQHGTRRLGGKSHLAKLTDAQVTKIKAALPNWKWGMGLEFAKRFGVGTTAISNIKRELRWKHI